MEAPRRPVWVQAADVAAVAFALLGLFVLIFGGFVLHVGPAQIRVHAAARLLFIAAALIAIRHTAHPSDPLHRRVLRGLRSQGESAQTIVRFAIGTRIAVLACAYFAVVTVGLSLPQVGFTVSSDPLTNLPARFDAGWYTTIALDGYYFEGRFDKQQNIAFFPAFPMLERIVGYPFGAFAPALPSERRTARLLWAGVAISIAAFAWAAVYLWRLARETIGESKAADAVALLAAYPFAAFFSAAYTESLFLLGAVGAVYHFRRRELLKAAAWGLLVGLTRPNGCFLSIVLLVFLLSDLWNLNSAIPQSRDSAIPRRNFFTSLAAAAAPGIGMLIYSAYVKHLTGAWFGWARLHETWGRSYTGLAPMERAYGWITDEGLLHVVQGVPFDTLNSLGLIFALLMLWAVFRRLGLAYVVFVLVNIVPPLLAGGVLSMGRVTATLFPLFLALAGSLSQRAVTAVVIASAVGQGLVTVLFFTWRPLF